MRYVNRIVVVAATLIVAVQVLTVTGVAEAVAQQAGFTYVITSPRVPLFVANVNDAQEPVQFTFAALAPEYTVPLSKKRLVIETISASVVEESRTEQFGGTRVGLQLKSGPSTVTHVLELSLVSKLVDEHGSVTKTSVSGARAVRMYADPGTKVSRSIERDSKQIDAIVSMTISGYLVEKNTLLVPPNQGAQAETQQVTDTAAP